MLINKAIFLDRDNTLILDDGYFHDSNKIQFLPGVIEGLYKLQSAGFLLIVVTNQSGIGRGYFPESDTVAMNKKIAEYLERHNVWIEKFYYCPHAPEMDCKCRKPKPFLVLNAVNEFNINIIQSFFIGDKAEDVETGRAAGAITVLLGSPKKSFSIIADLYAPDIKAASELIIEHEKNHK